jgi:hypothetical protein
MDPDMSSFLLVLCSPCASRQQMSHSTSRVVPWSHRVVGPGTHLSSGPRDVHTTVALKPAEAAQIGIAPHRHCAMPMQ